MTTVIDIDDTSQITIEGEPGGVVRLESNLKTTTRENKEELFDFRKYNHMIDGLESLVLAHFSEGIDVTSEAYRRGLNSALDAICNNS